MSDRDLPLGPFLPVLATAFMLTGRISCGVGEDYVCDQFCDDAGYVKGVWNHDEKRCDCSHAAAEPVLEPLRVKPAEPEVQQ